MPHDLHVPVGARPRRGDLVVVTTGTHIGRVGVVTSVGPLGCMVGLDCPGVADLLAFDWHELALDLTTPEGCDDGRRVLAEALLLDASRGLLFHYDYDHEAWVLRSPGSFKIIRSATIDPAAPNADALALAACLRAVLGVSDVG